MFPAPYNPANGIPKDEAKLRRRLGRAMLNFMHWVGRQGDEMDDVMREVELGRYRREIDKVAVRGIENSLAWHTYATWSNDGPERIDCFTRALACVESGRDAELKLGGPRQTWSDIHMRADCLFEIGRIHFHEGDPAIARDFLLRALPLAQEAERLRAAASVTNEDNLEGKIADLLVQLPD